jgi:hypothetical protein
MSYKAMIGRNVKLAFNLLRDLADPAILKKRDNTEFNFNTVEMKSKKTSNVETKILVIDEKYSSTENKVVSKEILLKTQEIGDITIYDQIELPDGIWTFGPIIKTDRFITITQIYR